MSRFRKPAEDVNLNLIPIMNLFTALIPFLLSSAVFFKLSMISVSVPVASSSGDTDVAKEEDTVTLNLQITKKEYLISASNEALLPARLDPLKATVRRSGAEEDGSAELSKLSEKIWRVKKAFPESKDAIVVPEGDVPYNDVIGAIDAARNFRAEANPEAEEMFTKVVISSRVK